MTEETTARKRRPLQGIAIMLAGLALFSILNAVVKAQSELFPLNQIIFFRNTFALLPLLAILYWSGGLGRLRTQRASHHVALSLLFTLTLFCIFYAYSVLPLADATAIAFSQPLIVVILASVLAFERANLLGWCSVGIGFAGVLIMVQPSGAGQGMGYAMALLGSALGAGSMLVQRSLALTEGSILIAFYTLSLSAIVTLPSLAFAWAPPTAPQTAGLIAMGVASGLCQYLIVHAFYHASAAIIAPVTYTKMLWAVLIGYLWFGDVPSVQILIGSVIVLVASVVNLAAARAPSHQSVAQN